MQSALFRANIKPPVELVVANLDMRRLLVVIEEEGLKNYENIK